jgi:hypothetical protein
MNKQLTSLTEWSQDHIRVVFESFRDEDSEKAIEQTFSKSINATVNDRQLGFAAIKQLVSSMRKEAPDGLKVQWQQTVEVPHDSKNRVRVGKAVRVDLRVFFLGWVVRGCVHHSWCSENFAWSYHTYQGIQT